MKTTVRTSSWPYLRAYVSTQMPTIIEKATYGTLTASLAASWLVGLDETILITKVDILFTGEQKTTSRNNSYPLELLVRFSLAHYTRHDCSPHRFCRRPRSPTFRISS